MKFKLSSKCTSNQAEQLAIVKSWDAIAGGVPQAIDKQKRATIYTDISLTIYSLKNPRNHKSLIHKIREKVIALEEHKWKIQLTWVKAHVGLYGNEIADKLAKEAATDRSLQACYDKIPKSVILNELRDESRAKWEIEWHNTNNGKVTKWFFPYVRDRLKTKLNVSSSFTAVLTGHVKTKAYLQRFHIIENSTCPCNKSEQSIDQLLYECDLVKQERNILIKQIQKTEKWPVTKNTHISKQQKHFKRFVDSIDFQKLQSE